MSGNSCVTFVTGRNLSTPIHRTSKLSRRTSGALVALAMLAIIGSGLRAQAPSSEFLVSEGKAGSVEVGMPVDEILEAFGRERVRVIDLNREGLFSPAIEIDVPGSGVRTPIVADITVGPCGGFSVSAISVKDPRFRTAEGLGVGSTLSELQRGRSVRVSREEGWSAVLPNANISFGLEAVPGTNGARVTLIRTWLNPRTVREQRCPDR